MTRVGAEAVHYSITRLKTPYNCWNNKGRRGDRPLPLHQYNKVGSRTILDTCYFLLNKVKAGPPFQSQAHMIKLFIQRPDQQGSARRPTTTV